MVSAIFRVGPEGRTVALKSGAEISIPPGALAQDTILGFRAMEETDMALPPLPDGLRAVSLFYACTPHGQTFDKPVEMRIPHDATDHLQALALRLENPEDEEWDPLSVGVKMQEHLAAISTDQFSFYVIAEPIRGGASSGECGDGEIDFGEACDDGINDGSYGGCLPGCLAPASYCGDGIVDMDVGEVCDPPSSCIQRSECGLVSGCNGARYEGVAEECTGQCVSGGVVNACEDGDGCCPDGCTAMEDNDCAACGNERLEPGEICENGTEQPCPESCDDGLACTTDVLVNGGDCQIYCQHEAITEIDGGDGCCPRGATPDTDEDCSGNCGNGVIDTDMGELCEPGVGSGCPTSCDDGNPCSEDLLSGSVENCNAGCTYTKVTQAADGDMCCPTGQTRNTDSDCASVCGNMQLEPGETCEPGSGMGCPTACDDDMACTADRLAGDPNMCNLTCVQTPIGMAIDDDGCCPPGANMATDSDCEAKCGNGVIEPGEMCEAGVGEGCPSDCDDRDACTADRLVGAAEDCTAACQHNPITDPRDGDGCCPASANEGNDSDCNAICGNGAIEGNEFCEPGVGDGCPRSCEDDDPCTTDRLTGMPGSCNARCVFAPIVTPENGDSCCPDGGNANNDSDCRPTCGNGEVETGELCDGDCPSGAAACDDGDPCTRDAVSGTGCSRTCVHEPITAAVNGDQCCPDSANANSDNDCSADCGNGVVEGNETCDGDCPTSCNDGNACTTDRLAGTPSNCNVRCVNAPIITPSDNDGCCPGSGNANNDNDCTADCGNGVVERPDETCEPGVGAGCPSCDDGDPCTTDERNGSPNSCNVTCSHSAVTTPRSGDGCCPDGTIFSQDNDCVLFCGDGIIDEAAGETCEPQVGPGCPMSDAACDTGNGCGRVVNGGSCTATCTQISGMIDGDGCCPPNVNSTVDADCPPECGNGVVERGEICDGEGCPTDPAQCGNDPCVSYSITGSPETCDAVCVEAPKAPNADARDSCCPGRPGQFNNNQDPDCEPVCGNGAVERNETCDPMAPAGCPTRESCETQQMCQSGMLTGSGCTAQCTPITISTPVDDDGCCPSGVTAAQDNDCMGCGNGEVEEGETCDGNCPQSCDDEDVCTSDALTGSAMSCDVICNFTPIDVSGETSDDCCPSGGERFQDIDCPAECGNGFVEGNELCEVDAVDPEQRCPTDADCNDGDVCTLDRAAMRAPCNVVCLNTPLPPTNAALDGCCPADGNEETDADCAEQAEKRCGNGMLDEGERCDIGASGDIACPTVCPDRDENPCTRETLVAGGTCDARCEVERLPIGPEDSCCPDGADSTTDPDCEPPVPTCGNGQLDRGERCDIGASPNDEIACPTVCPDRDQDPCTNETLVNGGTCEAQCQSLPAEVGVSDDCCPEGADPSTDSDCKEPEPVCGDGSITGDETCEPNGVNGDNICPTSCPDDGDGNACTVLELRGAGTCRETCVPRTITELGPRDGCCPAGNLGNEQDIDCIQVGVIE